jgi:hypothetical protein
MPIARRRRLGQCPQCGYPFFRSGADDCCTRCRLREALPPRPPPDPAVRDMVLAAVRAGTLRLRCP